MSLGANVLFLDQLCFFTYAFLSRRSYDQCESLFKQFTTALEDEENANFLQDLHSFFPLCYQYFFTIEDAIREDVTALQIVVRMIGLLRINQQIVASAQTALLFASMVLKKLSDKLGAISAKLDENNWPTFCKGLVQLICIELWNEKSEEETSNAIHLLLSMHKRQQREDAAVKLLNLLWDLKLKLSGNKLMLLYKLVKPDDFAMKYLELSNCLKTYIWCLSDFLKFYGDSIIVFQQSIEEQIHKLLENNHLPSK